MEKEVHENLNQMNKGITKETDENVIIFDNVPIISPNGDVLISGINFKI